jgi:hypothetical protein
MRFSYKEGKREYTMVHVIDLSANVPVYGQQMCFWCGAASAQMIMDGYPDPLHRVFIAQGPPTIPNCWDTIQANNSTAAADLATNWATDPQGLRECLRLLNPPPGGTWNIFMNANRDVLLFNILYWMNRNNYPVAVLINRGGHWVVIVGFQSDIEPILNSSPVLQQITYNDPEPHNVGSVITKTGALWFANEWNGNIVYAGTWQGNYVAIIEPPVKGTVKVQKVIRVGEKIIKPEEVVEQAYRWIKEADIARKAPYNILKKKGIRHLSPILVREEISPTRKPERTVPHYYLVLFGFEKETGACGVPLARIGIIFNAYTGKFEEVGAFGQPVRFIPKEEAINIAAKAMNLKDEEIKKMTSEKQITAYMMFQPSELTHIRLYPFWRITIKEKILYVDQLGKLYSSIKPCVPGD